MQKTDTIQVHTFKIVAVFVLFPLIIALCGMWQHYRLVQDTHVLLQEYDRSIAVVEQRLGASENTAMLIVTSQGKKTVGMPDLATLQKKRSTIVCYAQWQKWTALSAMGLGLMGAAGGLLSLNSIRRASMRALESRAALLYYFEQGLLCLPDRIGIIGLMSVLGLACVVSYEFLFYILMESALKYSTLLYGFGAVVAFLLYGFKLCWDMRNAAQLLFNISPLSLFGKSYSEEQAPLLWAFVREVAGKARTVLPDTIMLGMGEVCFVTEHPVHMGNEEFATGRTLYLSLPYMQYMSRPEAAALIAHELAHFTDDDTDYSLHLAPVYSQLLATINVMSTSRSSGGGLALLTAAPPYYWGGYYLNAFDAAVKLWGTERELAADQRGILAGGAEGMALVLLRLSVLVPHVEQALAEYWEQGGRCGDSVLRWVRECVRDKGLEDPAAYLHYALSHPADTHPSTKQRLEAVGIEPTARLLEQARSTDESSLLQELGLTGDGAAANSSVACSAGLEEDFAQAVQTHHSEIIEEFGTFQGVGTENVAVFENTNKVLLSTFVVMALAVVLLVTQKSVYVQLGACLGLVLSLCMLRTTWKSRNTPLLVMTPTGFFVGDMTEKDEIQWGGVENIQFHAAPHCIVITLVLKNTVPEPCFSADKRIKWKESAHELLVVFTGVRAPLTLASLQESIVAHWEGGTAREVLKGTS